MAIDTRRKRASAASTAFIRPRAVVPTGTIAQADRQHIGWSYSGISAGAPVSGNAPWLLEAAGVYAAGSERSGIYAAGAERGQV